MVVMPVEGMGVNIEIFWQLVLLTNEAELSVS
jgi:hypothetical protein